jgi:hypothetical protein
MIPPLRNTLQSAGIGSDLLLRSAARPKLFVLGAGVSKEFGLPLATDLLDVVVNYFKHSGNAAELKPLLEFVDAFYHDDARRQGKMPQAEEVLTFLDATAEYAQFRAKGPGYKWRPDHVAHVRNRFARMLGEYLWASQDALNADALSSLRKFVALAGVGHVYVTFNYDLLLEKALSFEGIPYHYNGTPRDGSVLVLKPHGSINWYSAADVATAISSDRFYKFGEEIYVCDALDRFSIPFRQMRAPVIVTPIVNKQFRTREQQKLWMLFSRVVKRARDVFIVGYSLPIVDHASRIVMNRLSEQHDLTKRITVVNPDRDHTLADHIADVITRRHILIRKTFGEWLSETPSI